MNKRPYFDLLEEAFPGMKRNIARCEAIGFPWASRTFLKKEQEEIVAHVGYLDYPMLIEGQIHRVGALHAVCAKLTHRGRGLTTNLIQEVLDWAKDQVQFVVLFTEIPQFYERLSFQKIQEFRFHLPLAHPTGSKTLQPLTDSLFLRLFAEREPSSNRLWVKDNGTIASYNTLFATYPTFWSLHYSPALDAILSFEIKEKTLHLYDVIASKLPSLDSILDHLPHPIDQIYFYFSPDRFTSAATPEPFVFDNGHFMVHGAWPTLNPFMISPLSRC